MCAPRRARVALHGIGFVDQDVAVLAVVHQRLHRGGITRDDNRAIPCVEAVAERISISSWRTENAVTLTSGPGNRSPALFRVRLDRASGWVVPIDAIGAAFDVDLPGFENVLGHGRDPFRPVYRQRFVTTHHPGREIRSGESDVWSECI